MDTGELYALPPEEFTAARDATARQAKADGDPAAAKALKALRRPSAAAWLVNRLARDQAELLGQLLELGPALAAAQAGGQADELRALGAQRRRLVEAVADAAVSSAGRSVGGPVRDEVVTTLEAALADPRSAQAVRSGRLVRALSYAGFGEVDLSDAVAEPSGELSDPGRRADGAAAQADRTGKGTGTGTRRGVKAGAEAADPEAAERASRQQAQQAEQQTRERIAAAEQQAHDAAGALDDSVRAAERAQQASDAAADEEVQAQASVRRAAEALAVAERVRDDAGSARERAEAAAERARGTVRTAQEAADAARRELDRLRRA